MNNPYIPAKGHKYLQNGLYIFIDKITVETNINTLQVNNGPIILLSELFIDTRGIPAKSVPEGHINLQNHGFPSPA